MSRKILNNNYLSMLCAELAMLLDAGMTIADCVQILIDDEPDKKGKEVLQTLLNSLDDGHTLSTSLKNSTHFPSYMIHMVEVGEKTGRVVETLKALSEYYERQIRLAVTIKNSILYPAVLLVLMIVVVLILIIQVLPIFNEVFSRLGTQMSPLAINLMQFGDWLGNAAITIATVFAALFVLLALMFIIPALRKGIGRCLANTFGHRGVFGKVAASRFVFAMRLAMASGLEITEAINTAAAVSAGSKAVENKHKKCIKLIEDGNPLSDSLTVSGILTPQEGKMLTIGARSGKSDEAMAEIARRSDINARESIDRIVARIEPTLVVVSSAIVGIILLSVMLPLMGIMTALG